jgi:hypothetical protein
MQHATPTEEPSASRYSADETQHQRKTWLRAVRLNEQHVSVQRGSLAPLRLGEGADFLCFTMGNLQHHNWAESSTVCCLSWFLYEKQYADVIGKKR